MDSKSYLKLTDYIEAGEKEALDLIFEMRSVIKHSHDNAEDSCANAIKIQITAERIANSLKNALAELHRISAQSLNDKPTRHNKRSK